jgi:pimeloyl-ACP methyl ester carboxylesterase
VFVRDIQTNATARASLDSSGIQGNSHSGFPVISADGRYVVFVSRASNLVTGDTNGFWDIFTRDIQMNSTARVSVNSGGVQGNNDSSRLFQPSISADGRYVAFESNASNLVGEDTNGTSDIFVRDTQTNTTTRVSVASSGEQANLSSVDPSISADGRYVAFYSTASNLVSGDTNGTSDIFVRDIVENSTTRISVDSDGTQANGSSYDPSISADGRYVAYDSNASNLVSGDTNGLVDIFVRDTVANNTTRVSLDSSGIQGDANSYAPSISANGHHVVFYSSASNLVNEDTNGMNDVFVHDRQSGQTKRVSLASDGTQGDGNSDSFSSISADGRYVTFGSNASNLVSGDSNGMSDVFVHENIDLPADSSISGRVTDGSSNPIPDVSISDEVGHTTTTDSSGNYTLSGLAAGAYVITPSKSGYTFSPASTPVTVPPDSTGQDFIGTTPTGKTPIVFVHGWLGASLPPSDCDSNHAKYEQPISADDAKGYFQGVGEQLKADSSNFDVFYAQLVSNSCYTPPLEANVDYLIQAIDQAKVTTGQSQVTLIAHSMGGLVARAYIEGPDYRGDVKTLFTFGSPHLGTPPGVLAFLLNELTLGDTCENYQPAVCDFSTIGMIPFNLKYRRNYNVDYHVISGDAPFLSRSALGMITGALIDGPDDGIVPTNSGRAVFLGTFDRWTTDEVHGPGSGGFLSLSLGPSTYFIRDGGASTSYTDCIKKVLVDGASNCGTVSIFTAQQDVPTTLAQHTPIENGTLLSGESATRNLSLEGGPTLFASQWQEGALAFTLIDPNGQTIDPAFAAANPGVVTYTADVSAATYYFPNATDGAWQLTVHAVTTPTGGSAFSTFAAFDSTVTLIGDVDNQWFAPGASATITATLGGSPSSATVTATVLRADGASDTLPLSAIGGGQYQAAYMVPNVPGYAEVQLVASGTTASSLSFERGTSLAFQISPNTFILNNNYADTPVLYPGLSTYQFLNVAVGINATISGKVGLSADLVDGSSNFVAHALTLQEVSAGTPTLTLQFNGIDIYSSQRNGPYTLTNVLLTDESGATLVTQQALAVYTTAPYFYMDFAPNQIYLPLVQR